MYNLKGFIRIESLINNVVGVNSPIGELSTLSLTYTRDRGEYFKTSFPGFTLVSMSSIDTVTGKKPVDPAFSDHVLAVSSWLVSYATTKGVAINLTDLTADLAAAYNTTMNNIILGPLVSNGGLSLPAFISWTNVALATNSIKVWYADSYFRQQYGNYEIVVVAPVANLDDFFLSASSARTSVQSRSLSASIDLIQAAKQGQPETVIRTNSYDYKNSLFTSVTFPTNWSVLIYGAAGDNIDAIKDAIIAYILSNTTHTREQWAALLPDLFKRTEFNLIPRWDKYAIPNLTVQAGIYSPVVNLAEMNTFVKARVPEISPTHINANLEVFGNPYRSLALACISNPDNLNNAFSITTIFPDLINIGTDSTDFNRMGTDTKAWLSMIEDMLVAAESVTETSDAPITMRKIKRGNTLYIAKVYGVIQYLVAAKTSYP